MKPARLLVNWYRLSGKWYASETLDVPDCLETWDNQHLDYIEQHQSTLQSSFVHHEFIMTVSCIGQDYEDTRFFERLTTYPRKK